MQGRSLQSLAHPQLKTIYAEGLLKTGKDHILPLGQEIQVGPVPF